MDQQGQRRAPSADLIIALVLMALTWVTRALASTTFITWDEPAWVYRSVHFLAALGRGDWAQTMLVGHPGVTTMWLGALGLIWHRWIAPTVAAADWQAVVALTTLNVHDATTIRYLAALLPAAKTFLPLAHAILAGVLFVLLRKLLDRPAALTSTALLALDPYGLALSRVLHIDALTAQFMLIAVLAAVVHARGLDGRSRRYVLLSGVAMGLAALTKSYGVLAGPVVALFWLAARWQRPFSDNASDSPTNRRWLPPWPSLRRSIVAWARDVALWTGVAAAVFVLAWPAMWVAPLGVLRGMLGLSLEYATRPGDATTAFFRGQVVADPGPWFYLVALWFRATPLAVLGGVLAVAGLAWRGAKPRRKAFRMNPSAGEAGRVAQDADETEEGLALSRRDAVATSGLMAYILFFLLAITLSRKKFDRYMLPAMLAWDIIAGIGLASAARLLWSMGRARGIPRGLAVSLTGLALVLAQAGVILGPLSPAYYLAYYNPLAGGIRRAVQTLPVGWGEGMEQAAHYLAAQEGAADAHIATWAVAGVAPFFPGHVAKPDMEGLANADYVVLYVGDQQVSMTWAQGLSDPLYVAHVNDTAYAWVYRNDYDREVAQAIDGAVDPGAPIVSNAPSSLQRRLSGSRPYYVIAGESEEQVAQALQAAAGDASHLFYLEFAGVQERATQFVQGQLAQGALLVWQKAFAYGTLSYYRRPDGAAFASVFPDKPVEGLFGDQLRLLGYGLGQGSLQYRQQAGIALSWRATRAPEQDYHIFLHLVDEQGRVWGKRDQPLLDDGARASSLWGDGQDHLSRYTVPLDAGIPPGEYWISIGLYRLNDVARLEIVGDDGRSRGTELRLGPLQVVSSLEPPGVEELAIPHPLSTRLGQGAELLGYDLAQRTYQSGEGLSVSLYWHAVATMPEKYDLVLRLSRDGEAVAESRAAPAGPGHPTDRWVPGEVLRYPHRLRVPADLASGDYDLAVNWIDTRGQWVLAKDQVLARVAVEHHERLFTPPAIQHPLTIGVGKLAELLGYDIADASVKPGDTVHLTLYWRAWQPSEVSYTVFTHLLDAGGAVRGQSDSVPARGERPMTGWVEGEIIVDPCDLAVAPDATPGPYRIEIGLYDPANGQRLPLTATDGASLPDRRLLIEETIQVE